MLSVSANYSLCVLSALSTVENPIKLVEYSDFHSKKDKTPNTKALKQFLLPPFQYQPLPLLPEMFYKSLHICVI